MLLVRDIAAAAEATGWVSLDTFLTLTHIRGTRNAHLADPGGSRARTVHERTTLLPLDAEVHGRFLTFDYCGHGTSAILQDHESLADVERSILSGSGVLNPFTEVVLAFVDGRHRTFEVRDASGRLLAKGGTQAVHRNELHTPDAATCHVVWTGG
jgi:hypothetical protein